MLFLILLGTYLELFVQQTILTSLLLFLDFVQYIYLVPCKYRWFKTYTKKIFLCKFSFSRERKRSWLDESEIAGVWQSLSVCMPPCHSAVGLYEGNTRMAERPIHSPISALSLAGLGWIWALDYLQLKRFNKAEEWRQAKEEAKTEYSSQCTPLPLPRSSPSSSSSHSYGRLLSLLWPILSLKPLTVYDSQQLIKRQSFCFHVRQLPGTHAAWMVRNNTSIW